MAQDLCRANYSQLEGDDFLRFSRVVAWPQHLVPSILASPQSFVTQQDAPASDNTCRSRSTGSCGSKGTRIIPLHSVPNLKKTHQTVQTCSNKNETTEGFWMTLVYLVYLVWFCFYFLSLAQILDSWVHPLHSIFLARKH